MPKAHKCTLNAQGTQVYTGHIYVQLIRNKWPKSITYDRNRYFF